MSAMAEGMSVSVVYSALECDVLSGLNFSPAWAIDFLCRDESPIVFASVCVSCAALHESAEGFPIR